MRNTGPGFENLRLQSQYLIECTYEMKRIYESIQNILSDWEGNQDSENFRKYLQIKDNIQNELEILTKLGEDTITELKEYDEIDSYIHHHFHS